MDGHYLGVRQFAEVQQPDSAGVYRYGIRISVCGIRRFNSEGKRQSHLSRQQLCINLVIEGTGSFQR